MNIRQISYISDLHLRAPILLRGSGSLFIAGDIGNPRSWGYRDFLYDHSDRWNNVYFTTGNHEYDNSRSRWLMDDTDRYIQKIADTRANLHFVRPGQVYKMGNYSIIGGTLWTGTMYGETNRRFVEQSLFMKRFLEAGDPSTTIVMTHHLPSYRLILPQFRNYPNPGAWASHSDYLLKYRIAAWICGHSHIQFDGIIENTRILMNAEQKKYRNALTYFLEK